MAEKRRIVMMRHLPEEITEEILYNLPIKSLLRFKCVSRSWLSLISSKAFIKEHLKRSIAKDDASGLTDLSHHKLLFTYKYYDETHGQLVYSLGSSSLRNKPIIEPTSYDHPVRDSRFGIKGSCNGLILMRYGYTWQRGSLFLWNPSTGKYRVIPSPSFDPVPPQADYLHMGVLRSVFGFGYDESNDEYKVVCIRDSKLLGPYYHQTHMYSSKTDSWKKIANSDKRIHGHYGKFVNGRLHWLAEYNRNRRSRDIISLHLGEESYQTFPHCLDDYSGSVSLVELGGYLGLVNLSVEDLNVWVMQEYGVRESWTKILTLSDFVDRGKPVYDDRGKPIRGSRTPLCWSKNGDVLVLFGPYVVVCNGKHMLRTSRVGMLDDQLSSIVYVESLVSPLTEDQ